MDTNQDAVWQEAVRHRKCLPDEHETLSIQRIRLSYVVWKNDLSG